MDYGAPRARGGETSSGPAAAVMLLFVSTGVPSRSHPIHSNPREDLITAPQPSGGVVSVPLGSVAGGEQTGSQVEVEVEVSITSQVTRISQSQDPVLYFNTGQINLCFLSTMFQ